jgi:hypothetical protein
MNLKFLGNNPIPEEFGTILKNYTKEIIRNNPKDIIDFSYQYFYCLEKKIPLMSTIETQINTEMSLNNIQTTNQKEVITSVIEAPDNNISKDNIIDKNSKPVTPNNSENRNENDDNNKLEDSPMKVPISRDIEEIIKKSEKKRPVSSFSGLSENNEEKKEIKDFISDLFFESEQNANGQLVNELEIK